MNALHKKKKNVCPEVLFFYLKFDTFEACHGHVCNMSENVFPVGSNKGRTQEDISNQGPLYTTMQLPVAVTDSPKTA